MKRILRACLIKASECIKSCRDKCLAKLRAHVVLAVAEDFRQLARHVTAEHTESQRHVQSLGERILLEIVGQAQELRDRSDKRLDDLTVFTESLLMEVVRMQRQLVQISEEIADHRHSQGTELRPTDDLLPVRRAA